MQKKIKVLITVISIIAFICLILSATLFILPAYRAKVIHDDLAIPEVIPIDSNIITTTTPPESKEVMSEISSEEVFSEEMDGEVSSEESEAPEEITYLPNPYADSFDKNSDCVAWIKIEDTKIDYPVMWTPEDECYYINKNFYGENDSNGCLLLDDESSVSPFSDNLIIHGHNMKSGAMFGDLDKYADSTYEKEHSKIYLYTKECLKEYEIVAVFKSQVFYEDDVCFKYYKYFNLDNEAKFNEYVAGIKGLSLYDTGITPVFGDKFITLSTCAYHVENGRFVVVARETEIKEYYQ